MIAAKIPKNQADYVRRILLKYSFIDREFKIKRTDTHVLIPLNKEPSEEILAEIGAHLDVVDESFDVQKKNPRSMREYLKGRIEPGKIDEINKSFDIIGDVVILEIPDEFESIKYLIADAALKFTKRRSVYRKGSKVKGIKRTRSLEFLAGEDISETIHKEYGSKFMLDVRKVYFSPRLATEREKIVRQVEDDEIILDMFAGVGPFSISIAREHMVRIYAVDINSDAIHYLKKNIELNKVKGEIIPILADVKEFLKNSDVEADRIIMNLPGMACKFLADAISSLKRGGILHYYEFSSDFEVPVARIREAAGSREVTILDKKRVKSSSPGRWHMGIDAKIH